MSTNSQIPLFFPRIRYVSRLAVSSSATTLRELCESAGVSCKASGAWTERVVDLIEAERLQITAEPSDWSVVQIALPLADPRKAARIALAVMAYALHDLVAKQSIMGAPWARIAAPRGRSFSGTALSTVERQRLYRLRKSRRA